MNFPELVRRLPWGKGVQVVKCNGDGLVAVNKPEGVLSHPNKKSENSRSVVVASYDLKRQVYELELEGERVEVFLLNRLDSATSGILLLSLVESTAKSVLHSFANKSARKTYAALVFGMPKRGSSDWRDRLSVKHSEGGVRAGLGGGSIAETKLLDFKPLPGVPLMSRLTLMPITGKTHQLRIQAAKRGIPIVGDRTYGDFSKNKQVAKSKKMKRLYLHCLETEVRYRIGTVEHVFKATSAVPF